MTARPDKTNTQLRTIAWDFDGVLNRSVRAGKFIWQHNFEADLGLPLNSFINFMFQGRFHQSLIGKADLIDLLEEWLRTQNTAITPSKLMDYWFSNDANIDDHTVDIMSDFRNRGFRTIIATNNEVRRSKYIKNNMGFDKMADEIFSAAHLGTAKPDPQFFAAITQTLATEPSTMVLVDDNAENVEAAKRAGWSGIQFFQNQHDDLADKLANCLK